MTSSITSRPIYLYLLVLSLCATGGLHAWRTLFDNFGVHVANLDGYHIGIIQSVRELPGLLALLFVYFLLFIREHKFALLSVMIMGIGIGITGFFPNFGGLLFTTLLMSTGFHYFETANQSLTLQYFSAAQAPLVFGRLRSRTSALNVGIGLFFIAGGPYLSYDFLYIFFGSLMVLAVLLVSFIDPSSTQIPVQKKKMIVKKKYWLFYLLTFLAGARRQIFVAFAVFLMVKKFDFSIQEIALLFLLNNVINYFLAPRIGRWVNSFGEQKILSVEYAGLLLVFCGYAFVTHPLAAAVLYIIDHLLFNFSIAIKTFFQKIAEPEDIAPSMAVGFTINHVAAVFLPALGGLLWLLDYRLVFLSASLLSLISLVAVQYISGQIAQRCDRQTVNS
ncbi:MFS transporter [Desulforhopalus singaporensis]|uniref:Major Facilitator Superfamily protein n=1 Tax=Desulforhopalus singaporensis TaxID=91360 RepID=A0A1H0PCE3_9BACT|nr:MFS transporter [Desulforhopalus singaporensis]SDP02681.1 Major Facilitator Superfamily protein [Desulforhopalus singaporensis]